MKLILLSTLLATGTALPPTNNGNVSSALEIQGAGPLIQALDSLVSTNDYADFSHINGEAEAASFSTSQNSFETVTEEGMRHFKVIDRILISLGKLNGIRISKIGENYWARSWPICNPFSRQTKQGLFLEYLDGVPHALWTPWGEIMLFLIDSPDSRRQPEDAVIEKLFPRMKIEMYMARSKGGLLPRYVGPIYKILALDDTTLPEPIKQDEDSYMSPELSEQVWKDMELA